MSAKDRFVQQTLREEGQRMMIYQGRAIAGATRRRSGSLLSRRHISVSGGDGMDGRMTFTHMAYERFLDIKKKKSAKRKHRRIHNRFVFGAYASISERLMYGFTEEVAESFRNAADSAK